MQTLRVNAESLQAARHRADGELSHRAAEASALKRMISHRYLSCDDQFDAAALELAGIFVADAVIGDERVNYVQSAKTRERSAVDLSRIRDQVDPLGGLDHRLLELQVGKARIGQPRL